MQQALGDSGGEHNSPSKVFTTLHNTATSSIKDTILNPYTAEHNTARSILHNTATSSGGSIKDKGQSIQILTLVGAPQGEAASAIINN